MEKLPKCLECKLLPITNYIELGKNKVGLCYKCSKKILGAAILQIATRVEKHQGKRTDLKK